MFHAGSLSMNFMTSHFETVIANNWQWWICSLLKVSTSAIPEGIRQDFPYDLLFAYLNGGGAMHAWYDVPSAQYCQIRQRWIYAESDVAWSDRCIVFHALSWPPQPLIFKYKSYGKSDAFRWRMLRLNLRANSPLPNYGNTVFQNDCPYYKFILRNPCMEFAQGDFPYDLLFDIKGGWVMYAW